MSIHEMHAALNRVIPVPELETDNPYTTNHALYSVHNRYLRLGAIALVVGNLVQGGVNWYLASEIHRQKITFIRENADGSTTILGDPDAYQPDADAFRKCLREWAEDQFSLIRATAQISYNRRQYFMSEQLNQAQASDEPAKRELEKFLAGSGLEIEARVTNVMIEAPMRPPQYRAYVSMEKIYRHPDGREEKRIRSVVQVVFMRMVAPSGYALHNPHGVIITYFKEQADI